MGVEVGVGVVVCVLVPRGIHEQKKRARNRPLSPACRMDDGLAVPKKKGGESRRILYKKMKRRIVLFCRKH